MDCLEYRFKLPEAMKRTLSIVAGLASVLGPSALAHAEDVERETAAPARVRQQVPNTAEREVTLERLLVHGRAQKPHLIFTVKKRPFRFDVGTERYSWQPRRAAGKTSDR